MFCESCNMHGVRFSRDIPTRWNSKYKLRCQSDEYKDLLCDFMRYNVQLFCILVNGICALKFVNY